MAIHINKISINKISILLITLVSLSLSHQTIANDPNVDKANVKNLVTPLMVSTIAKTEEFIKTNIITRLATVKENPNKDCLDTCKEVYEGAVDAMKKTLKSVDEGNYVEALVHVSAVGSYMGTCKDSIEEIHCDVNPEMTKFEDWSNGVISDATTKIASVAH